MDNGQIVVILNAETGENLFSFKASDIAIIALREVKSIEGKAEDEKTATGKIPAAKGQLFAHYAGRNALFGVIELGWKRIKAKAIAEMTDDDKAIYQLGEVEEAKKT